jgi:hypothetical protein
MQLLPHALFPELLDVIRHPLDSFLVRIARKKLGDLIRHVHHVL